jgi:hypothetical protein
MKNIILITLFAIAITGCSKRRPVDTVPYQTIKTSVQNVNFIFIGELENRKGYEHFSYQYKNRLGNDTHSDLMYDGGEFTIDRILLGTINKKSFSTVYHYYEDGTPPRVGDRYIVFANITSTGKSTKRILDATDDNINKVIKETKANQKPSGNPAPPSS